MKTTIYKTVLLSFIVFSGFFAAIGQQQPDSLMQYLQMAAKNNPALIQKFDEYQAALQKIPQVGGLPDPELSLGVFLSPMELISGSQIADLRLMQMFPWFGVLKNAKDEMSLMARAKFESFRDAKLQLYFDVQQTWFELQKNQQLIRISENNLEILHTLERLTLIRFKTGSTGATNSTASLGNVQTNTSLTTAAGTSGMQTMNNNSNSTTSAASNQASPAMQSSSMGSSSGGSGLVDLYAIQIETGDIENNIALLKNQQNTILSKFNSYLNRPVQAPVSLPDTIQPDSLNISIMLILDSMLANNPMLTMLDYEQQSLEAKRKMVSSMGYPMVGIGVNYSIINKSEMSTSTMNGKDMIMPMVTVTLPIYRKKYKAMQNETDFLKSATEQSYMSTSNTLQTEFYQAVQLFQDSQRRIILYKNQRVLAKKSLDIKVMSFSASGSSLSDILRIRQQLLNYEFKEIEAVTDYNTAIAWLNRLGNIETTEIR